jgi:hypothetical protein
VRAFSLPCSLVEGLAAISSFENGQYVNYFIVEVLGAAPLSWGEIHQASDWALIAIYLPFLGLMLDSSLVAPLKHSIVRRIKRSIERSTVAATFVATFFVVSELAGSYLSSQLGNVLGIICTGGLVFFFDPIQRVAERLENDALIALSGVGYSTD